MLRRSNYIMGTRSYELSEPQSCLLNPIPDYMRYRGGYTKLRNGKKTWLLDVQSMKQVIICVFYVR